MHYGTCQSEPVLRMPDSPLVKKRGRNNPFLIRILVFFLFVSLLILPAGAFTISPASPQAGQSVVFTSTVWMNNPRWNFGDGTPIMSGKSVTHTFSSAGTYTVRNYGTGIDSETITDSQSVTIQPLPVTPVPPDAVFTVDPSSPAVNQLVTFDASGTYDPSGIITSYTWDFGDDRTGEGMVVTHSYSVASSYTVTLRVWQSGILSLTANLGTSSKLLDSTSRQITVRLPQSPVAKFTFSPSSPEEGETVYFYASGSSAPDSTILVYKWNFGDGTTATMSASETTATHVYSGSGTKSITLTVTDDNENSGYLTQQLTVVPAARPDAVINVDTTSPQPGQAVRFDASKSVDPKGLIDRYEWTFGDGTSGSGKTVSHTFPGEGSYLVTLTIRSSGLSDTKNAAAYSDTANYQAVVSPYNPPVADFLYSPEKPGERETVSFDGSASYGTDGSIVSYHWDFGDGYVADGISVTHAYESTKTYTVTLTVIDSNKKQATKTGAVPVQVKFQIDLLPLIIVGIVVAGTGTVTIDQYKKYCRRKACPRVPVDITWSGGVGIKEPPPDCVKIDVQFSGGIRDEREK
jgi:PKD repeat protein